MESQSTVNGEEIHAKGSREKEVRKVKIYRIRRKLRKLDGVGGFFEAILAMMVVTLGMVLITASFTLITVGGRDRGTIDLEKECAMMSERIISSMEVCSEVGVLVHDHLGSITAGLLSPDDGLKGYKVILTEVPYGAARLILAKGTEPRDDGSTTSNSVPVNVQYSDTEVTAAILSVWAW